MVIDAGGRLSVLGYIFFSWDDKCCCRGLRAAYYLQEDRETLGLWYIGEDGTKANRENRIYGKAGAVLFYHGQTDDGNAMMSKALDFTDNSDDFQARNMRIM